MKKIEMNTIVDSFENAINALLSESNVDYLLKAQERAIAGRLAIQLSKILENERSPYSVDIEYNRDGYLKKVLCSNCEDFGKCDEKICRYWVAPDIIFHERGNHTNNIFFCEIKKDDTGIVDQKKVAAAIRDLDYKYGIVIYQFNKTGIKLLVLTKKDQSDYCYDFSAGKMILISSKPNECGRNENG